MLGLSIFEKLNFLRVWFIKKTQKIKYNNFSTKKGVFAILSISSFALIIPLYFANAQVVMGAIVSTIISGLIGVSAAVGYIAAMFALFFIFSSTLLEYGNVILNWAITSPFQMSMTNPNNNIVIRLGWTLMRDFTNMFFILGLAYIGLATALDIAGFDTKKTFISLLLVALLINFTPVICGIIVDISNLITNFFLSDVDFNAVLKVLNDNFGTVTNYSNWIEHAGVAVIKLTISIIYSFIAGLILLTFGGLFLLRNIMLWVLVVFSPLAFFAFIFPKTKKWFDMWWKQFLEWSIIAIPAAFFLYLGTHLVYAMQNSSIIQYNLSDPSAGLGTKLIPYFMVLIFLAIGLGATKKTTPMGAGMIIGFADKMKGRALGIATKAKAITKQGIKSSIGALPDTIGAAKIAKESGKKFGFGAASKSAAISTLQGAGEGAFGKGRARWAGDIADVISGGAAWQRRRAKIMDYKNIEQDVANTPMPQIQNDLEQALAKGTLNKGGIKEHAIKGASIAHLIKNDKFKFEGPEARQVIEYMEDMHPGLNIGQLFSKNPDLSMFTKDNRAKIDIEAERIISDAKSKGVTISEDKARENAKYKIMQDSMSRPNKEKGRTLATRSLKSKYTAAGMLENPRLVDDIIEKGSSAQINALIEGIESFIKEKPHITIEEMKKAVRLNSKLRFAQSQNP